MATYTIAPKTIRELPSQEVVSVIVSALDIEICRYLVSVANRELPVDEHVRIFRELKGWTHDHVSSTTMNQSLGYLVGVHTVLEGLLLTTSTEYEEPNTWRFVIAPETLELLRIKVDQR